MTNKKHVLVVGGGFAGIKAALELAKAPEFFTVTLISDQENFRYYPTLYHTATGGATAQSSIPLATLFAESAITVIRAEVTKINRDKKQIITKDHDRLQYDILILALGSVTNYFGIPGMEEFSYSIKSVEQAKRLKAHLHKQLDDGKRPDLNYVVVGGGPTGIELAGVLPAYLKRIAEAHGIKRKAIHVDLVEAAPQLIPRMPKRMGATIAKRLRHLGVRLYLDKKVEGATATSLMVGGKPIQSHTVVWTAGVANHPFFTKNDFVLTERHKVKVDEFLQAERDIYVLGDNSDTKYSGMAQTALYDAVVISRNLILEARGENMTPYKPKAPITVIPVGHNWAAVQWGKVLLFGKLGWALRLAGDAVGFSDYQPWWKAGRQWLTEFTEEEECPACAKHSRRV